MMKAAWASMGKNLNMAGALVSGMLGSGRSYVRWAMAGAAAGAIKNASTNVLNPGSSSASLRQDVTSGAMLGVGARAIRGMGIGAANRRRARGR